MSTTLIRPDADMPAATTADATRPLRRATEPGEEVEVGVGGDLDPSPSRRLTVTQLQQALRLAYAANADIVTAIDQLPGVDYWTAEHHGPMPSLPCDGTWLTVVPAHAGAGASIVALALADAAAGQTAPGQVHLIECANPARYGLAAATDTELGIDTTGAWQVGRRATVTVYRRAIAAQQGDPWIWPTMLRTFEDGSPNQPVILDLSGTGDAGEATHSIVRQTAATVLVTHCSVPGIRAVDRLIEHWLTVRTCADAPAPAKRLEDRVIVVAVGPRRWPGAVTASLSPRLAGLRRAGRVVPVPVDARLWVTGASSAPLPPRVRAAARMVLTLLPPEFHDDASVVSPTRGASASDGMDGDRDSLDALFDLPAENRR